MSLDNILNNHPNQLPGDEYKGVDIDHYIVSPSHYKEGKIECIDALAAATVNKTGIEAVCVANVIKYLWRYESKGGVQDIKKAKWYLERLLKELDND